MGSRNTAVDFLALLMSSEHSLELNPLHVSGKMCQWTDFWAGLSRIPENQGPTLCATKGL